MTDKWDIKPNATFRFWTDDHTIGRSEYRVHVYETDAPISIVAIDEEDSHVLAAAANLDVGTPIGSKGYREAFFGGRSMIFLDSHPQRYSVNSMGDVNVYTSWLQPQNTWITRHALLPVMLFGALDTGHSYTRIGRPEALGLPPVEIGKSANVPVGYVWPPR